MQINNKDLIKFNRTALDYLVQGEKVVIIAVSIFISVGMFIQVVLRYVFFTTIFGLEEILLFTMGWLYFIGGAYSVHTESYIKADILTLIIKNTRTRKPFEIVSLVLSLIAALLFSYYSLKYAVWMGRNHLVSPTFFISMNYSFGALVVGGILMSIHFFLLLLQKIKSKI